MNSSEFQPIPPTPTPPAPSRAITRLGWPDRLLIIGFCLLQLVLVAVLLFAARPLLFDRSGDAAPAAACPAAFPCAVADAAADDLELDEAIEPPELPADIPAPEAPAPIFAHATRKRAARPAAPPANAAPSAPAPSAPAPAALPAAIDPFDADPFFDAPFAVPALPVPDAFFDEPVAATVVRAAIEDMRQMRSLFDAGPAWVDSPTRPAVGMSTLSNRYEIVLDRVDPASLDVALDGRMLSLAYRESSQTPNAASSQSMASRFLLPGPVADADALHVLPDPANRRATVVVYKPGAAPANAAAAPAADAAAAPAEQPL